jgi:DNA-binding transcriptional LysR family regulator
LQLDLSDLQLVKAVAEAGSLVRTAPQLHLTPSALSHRLSRLEPRLGAAEAGMRPPTRR